MSPNIYLSLPSASLFKLRPASEPWTLAAPPVGSSPYAPPFSIPEKIYSDVYDARVPLTIASVYAVTVVIMNRVNAARGNKPWAISKTRVFQWLVILHNVFLAVYSAWTFVGMWNGLKRTIPSPSGPNGLVGVVDSLCKLHGPAGLGNGASYSPAVNNWTAYTPASLENGAPSTTVPGRLWNECLAFYGWFFYLSKFYEVVDTIIILAKGKRSSTLQTYHHAGAMMCMWAGMRYMTPAIWLFCFWNSGVHALMYTYYTITAFSIRVPKAIKQTLTTMQIMQFVVGVFYAAAHSFVSYDVPVSVRSVAETVSTAAPDVLKKIIYRAAGAEGLAEKAAAGTETVSRSVTESMHYEEVNCITTSGQTFAIWLNVFYLGPLMYLFMRFFYRSYIRRSTPKPTANGHARVKAAEGAFMDASKGLERNLNGNAQRISGKKH